MFLARDGSIRLGDFGLSRATAPPRLPYYHQASSHLVGVGNSSTGVRMSPFCSASSSSSLAPHLHHLHAPHCSLSRHPDARTSNALLLASRTALSSSTTKLMDVATQSGGPSLDMISLSASSSPLQNPFHSTIGDSGHHHHHQHHYDLYPDVVNSKGFSLLPPATAPAVASGGILSIHSIPLEQERLGETAKTFKKAGKKGEKGILSSLEGNGVVGRKSSPPLASSRVSRRKGGGREEDEGMNDEEPSEERKDSYEYPLHPTHMLIPHDDQQHHHIHPLDPHHEEEIYSATTTTTSPVANSSVPRFQWFKHFRMCLPKKFHFFSEENPKTLLRGLRGDKHPLHVSQQQGGGRQPHSCYSLFSSSSSRVLSMVPEEQHAAYPGGLLEKKLMKFGEEKDLRKEKILISKEKEKYELKEERGGGINYALLKKSGRQGDSFDDDQKKKGFTISGREKKSILSSFLGYLLHFLRSMLTCGIKLWRSEAAKRMETHVPASYDDLLVSFREAIRQRGLFAAVYLQLKIWFQMILDFFGHLVFEVVPQTVTSFLFSQSSSLSYSGSTVSLGNVSPSLSGGGGIIEERRLDFPPSTGLRRRLLEEKRRMKRELLGSRPEPRKGILPTGTTTRYITTTACGSASVMSQAGTDCYMAPEILSESPKYGKPVRKPIRHTHTDG